MKKAVLAVLIFAVVSGFFFWRLNARVAQEGAGSNEINLTYWGLEDQDIIQSAVTTYESLHPKVKITYVKQSLLNYRPRLQTQLRTGNGPDLFRIHVSWLPMFNGDLSPLPPTVFSGEDYNRSFYPVVKDIASNLGDKYFIPLEIDGLALFYNEDILKGAGIGAPRSWEEFRDAARKVTVKDQSGQIQTAGAALGTTNNVDFWPEIIALLFLQQPAGNLALPSNKDGAEVLQFYTSFVTDPKNKTWDLTLLPSGQAFAQGLLAFYFAPASQARVIKEANPNLVFKTTPVPQLLGKNVTLGTFWVEAVSSRSKKQKEAWEFLKFLSSAEQLQAIFQQKSTASGFGRPFPRPDLAGFLVADQTLATFIAQAPYYKVWYLNSNTADAGINEEVVRAFEVAVNATLAGQEALGTLQATEVSLKQILPKYGVR